ncbi:MAG TPA: ABC transporter substrate-binding protein [Thauera sp.]|nr:ABC transporter substrate-binding protein [Thauera sp.]
MWMRRLAMAVALMLAASAAQAARYEVMIVTWRGCEEACEGFQAQLRERGVDVEFVLRDAAQDRGRLPAFLAEARARQVDLILSWGTSVTQGLAGTLGEPGDPADFNHDIPQVFMIVADPVGAGLVESLERTGRRNLTGTYNRVPEEVNIETIRALRPDFRRLGLIYNGNEPNSVLKRAELAALATRLDFELVAQALPLAADGEPREADIAPAIAALKADGADFLYLGSSSFLQRAGRTVTATAVQHGLAVLSPYEQLVREASALISVAPRYRDVGRLAGVQAERILTEGRQGGDLPVLQMRDFAVVINMQVARTLRLFPPLPLLQVAETVN